MAGNWRWAAGIAAAAALAWALTRRADPPPPPEPPLPVAPAAPSVPDAPVAPPKRKPAPRPKPAAAPIAAPEARGEGLRDPGEALGGTPPERGEKPNPK